MAWHSVRRRSRPNIESYHGTSPGCGVRRQADRSVPRVGSAFRQTGGAGPAEAGPHGCGLRMRAVWREVAAARPDAHILQIGPPDPDLDGPPAAVAAGVRGHVSQAVLSSQLVD